MISTDNIVPKDTEEATEEAEYAYTYLVLVTCPVAWYHKGFPSKLNNLISWKHHGLFYLGWPLSIDTPLGPNKPFIPVARSQDFLYDENGLPK